MKAQLLFVLMIGFLLGTLLTPNLGAQAQSGDQPVADELPTIEAEYQFQADGYDLRYYFTCTPGLLGDEYLLLYWHDPVRGLVGYSCQIDHAIQVKPVRGAGPRRAA